MPASRVGTFLQMAKSRHHISVPQALVKDSKFPFVAGEKVRVSIDVEGNRLIVEHALPGEDCDEDSQQASAS